MFVFNYCDFSVLYSITPEDCCKSKQKAKIIGSYFVCHGKLYTTWTNDFYRHFSKNTYGNLIVNWFFLLIYIYQIQPGLLDCHPGLSSSYCLPKLWKWILTIPRIDWFVCIAFVATISFQSIHSIILRRVIIPRAVQTIELIQLFLE